ncbi:MAG: hypothetical protein QM817_10905 [Archangium sp.]
MKLALLLALALGADGGPEPVDAGPQMSTTRANMLREARVMRAEGAPNAALLADGVASTDGDTWDNPRAAVLQKGGVIEWELVQIEPVRNMRIQADNNDRYIVSGSTDGVNWFVLWVANPVDLPGVQTRTAPELQPLPVRYIRLTADGGDGMYSITELELYDSPGSLRGAQLTRVEPAPPPPPPPAPPFDTGFVVVFGVAALGVYYVTWARRRSRVINAPPAPPAPATPPVEEKKS